MTLWPRREDAARRWRRTQQSLALFRRSLGVRDGRTLDCMNMVAGMELTLSDYEHAGMVIEEALPIERELFPADERLATTLAELATLRLRTGSAADALAPAEEALALAVKAAGEDSLYTALAYSVVARSIARPIAPAAPCRCTGAPARFTKSSSAREHPSVASLLAQEGLLLAGEGKLATAAQIMERALAMLEHTCPGCAYERWTANAISPRYASARVDTPKPSGCWRRRWRSANRRSRNLPRRTNCARRSSDVRRKEEHVEMADRRH